MMMLNIIASSARIPVSITEDIIIPPNFDEIGRANYFERVRSFIRPYITLSCKQDTPKTV